MLPREVLSHTLARAAGYGDWTDLFLEHRTCCSIPWDGSEVTLVLERKE